MSQYYFVLQSLRKALPKTHHAFSHCKHFYTQQAFTQRSFDTQKAFTHSKLLHTVSSYTEKLLHTENLLHTECFTHSKLYTEKAFYTKKTFTHSKLLRREAFKPRKLLHTASFYTKKRWHREASLYIMTAEIAAPKPGSRRQRKKNTILKSPSGLSKKGGWRNSLVDPGGARSGTSKEWNPKLYRMDGPD